MILTQKQKQLCAEAVELPKDELMPFLEKHALTGGPWFYYHDNSRELRKRKTRTRQYRIRVERLVKQQGRCALCDTDIAPDARCCLDRTDKVVCAGCNQYLTAWRRLRADGIGEQDTVKFDGGTKADTTSEPDNSPDGAPETGPGNVPIFGA